MKISRRNLLKLAGASAAMAAQPVAGSLQSAAVVAAPSAGGELFAVVSPGKAWGVFNGYHEAYHHASMIRHSGGVCTSHVRCTPAFAEQMRSGALKSFVEVDGCAVTCSEAEARGMDLLRGALDRARARRQLIKHYRGVALARINSRDRASPDTCWYVLARFEDGRPPVVAGTAADEAEAIAEARRRSPEHSRLDVQMCSSILYQQLRAHLDDDVPMPEIISSSDLHMTQKDVEQRLDADPLFKFAVVGNSAARTAAAPGGKYIAYDRRDNWIYGSGGDENAALESALWADAYLDGRELLVARASPVLASFAAAKGLEIPGFWRRFGGLARHESELLEPRPAQPQSGTIRPPRPQWKQW